MAIPLIIDTDPGVDDALAIYLAINCKKFDLCGLTTVYGNVHTPQATKNARELLKIFNRNDITVKHGASAPLFKELSEPAYFVHGEDGLGNLTKPLSKEEKLAEYPNEATQFIIDSAHKYPGELCICGIGPLTNLALAVKIDPTIVHKIKEIVILGGTIYRPGNVSPIAEANIFNDYHAADIVFNAGWNISIIGLDISMKVLISEKELQELDNSNEQAKQFLAKINKFYQQFYIKKRNIVNGTVCHDATALCYFIDPDIFTKKQGYMRVITDGLARGGLVFKEQHQSYGDNDEMYWKDKPLVNACVDVNLSEIKKILNKYIIYA